MTKPMILGHRGSPYTATENTLDSLRAALDEGADGVEFDVQYTRDGALVLFHDTSFAGRPVHQYRYRELVEAMGHGMSTLPEILDGLPRSAFLYCEFKRQGSVAEARAAEEIASLLRARGADAQTMLASFDPWFLRCASAASPGLPIGLILERSMLVADGELDLSGLPFVGTVSMSVDLVETPVLAACAGRRTLAWPVDQEDWLRRALANPALGGVVTKHPALAVRLRDGG